MSRRNSWPQLVNDEHTNHVPLKSANNTSFYKTTQNMFTLKINDPKVRYKLRKKLREFRITRKKSELLEEKSELLEENSELLEEKQNF